MEFNYEELPEEIWELILNRLGDDHASEFESLSMVSKRLLSLTDRLRFHFTVVDQTYLIHGTICRFIYRFKNLKALDLSKLKNYNVETVLLVIARSSVALNLEVVDISNHDSVPIEGLKELGLSNRKIKVLKCANVVKLRDADLIAIAKFHPDLEELDISYPRNKFEIDAFRSYSISEIMITDAGIEGLSSGLRNLTKLNISMNPLLTDKSLVDLSLNCLHLQEILFVKCIMITMKGVRFMVHNSPNLRSISMCLISNIHGTDSLFINPVTSGRCLSSLHFIDSDISDEFLNSVVQADIQLKSVSLSDSCSYSIDGLSSFLHAYHSLKFVNLTKNNSLCDNSIIALSPYLHDLVSVKLNFCHKLTSTSLFALIINCLVLEHVEMEHTSLGKEDQDTCMNVLNDAHKKSLSIKSLKLGWNSHMSDECLLKIALVCPNLKKLDVSSCSGIASSLGKILKICPEIEHLSIEDCDGVKNIGLKMEPLRLKKLHMARSGVNDEGLTEIAVSCNELVKLDLEGCQHVTTSAVKFMVKNCLKLREVNLMGCLNLHVFIVDWMVHMRPSLRKLVPPSYAVTTESQRRLMLRHGCLVCDK